MAGGKPHGLMPRQSRDNWSERELSAIPATRRFEGDDEELRGAVLEAISVSAASDAAGDSYLASAEAGRGNDHAHTPATKERPTLSPLPDAALELLSSLLPRVFARLGVPRQGWPALLMLPLMHDGRVRGR